MWRLLTDIGKIPVFTGYLYFYHYAVSADPTVYVIDDITSVVAIYKHVEMYPHCY